MAQETAQGEKRLKKMAHSNISLQIYFDGRKNTTPKVRPITSETEGYGSPVNGRGGGGTALLPATAAAAAASGKPCRDNGTSAPDSSGGPSWATDGEQLAAGGACRTSDVSFYLFPSSKRFH